MLFFKLLINRYFTLGLLNNLHYFVPAISCSNYQHCLNVRVTYGEDFRQILAMVSVSTGLPNGLGEVDSGLFSKCFFPKCHTVVF